MNLEFFIRMREMVSGGLAKMAANAQKATNQMKAGNNILSQSYDEIKDKVKALEDTISKSKTVSQIREARKELEQLQKMQSRHIGNTDKGGGFMSGMVGNTLRQVLPMAGIAGAIALGGSMLTSGLEAQARSVSFNVMAGKSEGTRLNKDLTKYAQDSIYGNEVYGNAQTMMGFDINSKDVMPDMKMIGDIAMGDAQKLQSLTLAFSQVNAAGKLTGQDLLQFVNAGFNPLQEIAKKTGISLGDLRTAVSDGAISFKMVEEAFKSATSAGGRFYNMTEEIGKTDYGKLQAFMGQLSGLGMQIGGLLAPALGLVVTGLSQIVSFVTSAIDLFTEYSDVIGLVSVMLAAGSIAYGIYFVAANAAVLSTSAMTWAAGIQTIAVGALSTAWTWLSAAMLANPIGIIIALVAALVVGVIYAWNKFEGFRAAIYGLWEAVKQVFTNIGSFFKTIFSPIFEAIDAFKDGRWADGAKAVGQLAFNITPMGMAAAAVGFAAKGGFTNGVGDAYNRGNADLLNSEKSDSINKMFAAGKGGIETAPGSAGLSSSYDSLKGYKGSSEADSVAKGVTSGGPRVININGVKFTDKVEIHCQNLTEGMDEIADKFDEYLLRILNSGAALQ